MWRRQREDDGRLRSVIQFLRMTGTENLLPVRENRAQRNTFCNFGIELAEIIYTVPACSVPKHSAPVTYRVFHIVRTKSQSYDLVSFKVILNRKSSKD